MEEKKEPASVELSDEQLEGAAGGFFGDYAGDGAKWVQNRDHCEHFICKACGARADSAALSTHKCSGGTYKFNCCLACRYGTLSAETLYRCYHPANMEK